MTKPKLRGEPRAKSVEQFCKDEKISMPVCDPVSYNPNMESNDWTREASHYSVFLYREADNQSYPLATYFSQGAAFTEPPTAAEVLYSLLMDAYGIVNTNSFEEWADDFGYDKDSRSVEKTYKITVEQSKQLRWFFGEKLYNDALSGGVEL